MDRRQERSIIFQVRKESGCYTSFCISESISREICSKFTNLIEEASRSQRTAKQLTVFLNDVDAESFLIIVTYFSSSNSKITSKSLIPLLTVVNKYKIHEMLADLQELVFRSLSVENFCEIFKFYSDKNDYEMLCRCLQILPRLNGDHKKILFSSSFLKLKPVPGLRLLLQSRYFQVSKKEIWKELKKSWIWKVKHSHFRQLMSHSELTPKGEFLSRILHPIAEICDAESYFPDFNRKVSTFTGISSGIDQSGTDDDQSDHSDFSHVDIAPSSSVCQSWPENLKSLGVNSFSRINQQDLEHISVKYGSGTMLLTAVDSIIEQDEFFIIPGTAQTPKREGETMSFHSEEIYDQTNPTSISIQYGAGSMFFEAKWAEFVDI